MGGAKSWVPPAMATGVASADRSVDASVVGVDRLADPDSEVLAPGGEVSMATAVGTLVGGAGGVSVGAGAGVLASATSVAIADIVACCDSSTDSVGSGAGGVLVGVNSGVFVGIPATISDGIGRGISDSDDLLIDISNPDNSYPK